MKLEQFLTYLAILEIVSPMGHFFLSFCIHVGFAFWPRTTGRATAGIHPPGGSAARVQEEQHIPDKEAGV